MKIANFAMAMALSASAIASPDNDPARPAGRAPDANPGACYAIANPDMRNLCRARAAGDASSCYAILDADLRAYCRATVGGAVQAAWQKWRSRACSEQFELISRP